MHNNNELTMRSAQWATSTKRLVLHYNSRKMWQVTVNIRRNLERSFCDSKYTAPSFQIFFGLIIIINNNNKRKFIRRSNITIESLQGRRTMFAARTLETVSQ